MKCPRCKKDVMEISFISGVCNDCGKNPKIKREVRKALNGFNEVAREVLK